jgi:ADP-ribose pyrophosphatase YjhB (NUDIX family)
MPDKRIKPFSNSEFKEIYSKVPRLTVEVILKVGDGVVLMKRTEKSWRGKWHIPGGTVFYEETLEKAVKRVAKEELNVEIDVDGLIGYIEYPSEKKERGFGTSIGIAFKCSPTNKPNLELIEKEGVKIFKKLPKNLIEEQRKILTRIV